MSDVKLGTGQFSQLVTPVNLDGTVIVGGGSGGGGGDASAANQTVVQALAGSDASKAIAVQGITNGKAIPVTANAGVNLNTSALALESGGNLAGINSKLPVSLGAKPASQSLPVTLSTDGVASGIAAQIGELQSTPTANTVLARLKTLSDILTLPAAYLFSATVTRPANTTAYAANSVYGGLFELTAVGTPPPTGASIIITEIVLVLGISSAPSGMSSFVFYPYTSSPSAIPNGGTWSAPSPLVDDLTLPYPNGFLLSQSQIRGGGSLVSQNTDLKYALILSGTSIFGYLVTTGGFTPANPSERFSLRVRALVA